MEKLTPVVETVAGPAPDRPASWPFCAGAMADCIRAHDWGATALGPVAGWPAALTFAVSTMLESRFPSLVAWGPHRIGIYNDACMPIFGDRPDPLGRPFDVAWADIWDDVRLVYESAASGQLCFFEDLPLNVPRPGLPDLSWWTFSCSPIRNERGAIGGVQATILETSPRIRLERRQAFLLGLGDALRRLNDGAEIAAEVCARLGRHLGADRVGYAEIDPEAGEARVGRGWTADERPDRPGRYVLSAFGHGFIAQLASGSTALVNDVARDPRTADGSIYAAFGIGAILVVPLIRRGRWVNALSIAGAAPHVWTQEEATLATAVAERTWEAVERARAEASLRESRDRLQAALEAARMAAWDWDPAADRVAVSGTVEEVFGLMPGETIGSSSDGLSHLHPEDRERHRETIAAAGASRTGYESEFRIIRRIDGEVAWLEERAHPRTDPVTGEIGLAGLVWDVTRRKRAEIACEQARREVADELAVMTKLHDWAVRIARPAEWAGLLDEMLTAAMHVLDADFGTIRTFDPEAETLTVLAHRGCDESYLERFRTVAASEADSVWNRALRGKRRVVADDLRKTTDRAGDDKVLREAAREFGFHAVQVTPLFDRAGAPVGALATGFRRQRRSTEREARLVDLYGAQIADVIGVRQARNALATSEQRFRRLIEGIPQLVWRYEQEGHSTWCSPQWFAYTGLTREGSLDRGWLDAMHPDDRPVILDAWARAERLGAYECECRIWSARERRYRWFQERAVAEPLGDGGVEWIGTSTDIDALRTLHEHQRALLAELQHRVRHTLSRLRTIVRRTAEDGGSVDDYVLRLDGRLDALARAQAPVMRDPNAGVDLHELVADELTAHQAREGERASVCGPAVRLRPGAADILALALHELAINAVEHGALSRDRGRIGVSWRIETGAAPRRLVFEWAESAHGFRPLNEPVREGFGFGLLNRTLADELDARTTIAFGRRGLSCTIDLPMTPRLVLP